MDLFSSVRTAFERISVFSTSACGGCQKDGHRHDPGLNHVFNLHPLGDAEPEAVRATQRGVRLLHEGRLEESLRELHDARQLSHTSHEAYSNLGCAYHQAGDDNSALYWYREAYRLAPRDETAVLALSLLEQRRGQVDEAQRLLVVFLQEVDSAHIGALKQLGKLHMYGEHWSKAAGCFHRLIAIDPTNNEWPAQLQVCLDQLPVKNDRGEAVLNPGGFPGMFARAFSFAEPILRSAIPADSKEAMSVQGMSTDSRGGNVGSKELYRNYPPTPSTTSSSMASATFVDRGPVSERGGMPHSRGSFRVQSPRGSRNSGPPNFAPIQEFPSPPRQSGGPPRDGYGPGAPRQGGGGLRPGGPPHAAGAALEEAQRHRESGRTDAALAVYRSLLQRDCRDAEALLGLADCQYDLGNVDAAIEAAKQLLGLRPDDAEANLRVAELLLAAGHDADMAEPYLKRAGNDPSARRTLQLRLLCTQAEAALAREDHAKALAGASEAVRLDASSPRALILLGTARLRVAEYPAALRAINAALEAIGNGSSSESRRNRGTAHGLSAQAHERLRQYPQALSEVQSALGVFPQLTSARIVRAMALQQSGQATEAEAELRGVLQREPENAQARLQLGYCQLCSGDFNAAATLEGCVTGAGTSRSMLGTAKVYLALAIDSFPERAGHRHADLVVKEGLSLHRNLSHVWKEIENGLANNPTDAVQRLRGICDLDLTSAQARQLLRLLARAAGRMDLAQAMNGMGGLGGSCRQLGGGPGGASSRAPSVPPNRWAPAPSGASTPGNDYGCPRTRSALGFTQDFASSGAATPLQRGPSQGRMRSSSREPWQMQGGPGPSGRSRDFPAAAQRGRSGSPGRGGGPMGSFGPQGHHGPPNDGGHRGRRSAMGSRELSPVPDADSNALTIGWNELIRREQLVFGPQLGAGGSAEVYRGSWNGQEVAIKKITGVGHLEEMKKEINALRRLRHPRLVRFIGACVEPPLLLVVTEFMSGGSLHDHLFGPRRDQPLAPLQRWMIACHMAEGMCFLHSQRVVHRDLKSMNILLDAQQNAKICDFGLAQQMEATHIARKLDGEGGSPRYMAPECYDAAHGKLTEKVDIWAMGCILIELFGGVLPYSDCSTMAQLSARILVERRPPDVPQAVPPPMANLICRCVAFEAGRRLGAMELQGELCRLRPRY